MPSQHPHAISSKTLLLRLRYDYLLVRYDSPAHVLREHHRDAAYAFLFDQDIDTGSVDSLFGPALRANGADWSESSAPSRWSSTPVDGALIPTLALEMKAPESTRLAYSNFSASRIIIDELSSRAAQAFRCAAPSRGMIRAHEDLRISTTPSAEYIRAKLGLTLLHFKKILDADALALELSALCSGALAPSAHALSL